MLDKEKIKDEGKGFLKELLSDVIQGLIGKFIILPLVIMAFFWYAWSNLFSLDKAKETVSTVASYSVIKGKETYENISDKVKESNISSKVKTIAIESKEKMQDVLDVNLSNTVLLESTRNVLDTNLTEKVKSSVILNSISNSLEKIKIEKVKDENITENSNLKEELKRGFKVGLNKFFSKKEVTTENE